LTQRWVIQIFLSTQSRALHVYKHTFIDLCALSKA
jgi:hypothetical protein